MQPTEGNTSLAGRPTAGKGLTFLQWLLLALILLAAAALRLYSIDWDSGTLPHPDERSTVAFYAPSIEWPQDLISALDPHRSPLNPFWDVKGQHRRSYTYGHFPLYALVLMAGLFHRLAPLADHLGLAGIVVQVMEQARSPVGYAYIGRFLMALADIATVYLVFLLGRRLYGRWAGLLAAALSAFTVLQIQLAHFFAVDPVSTTFTLLALYGSILMVDRRGAGPAILTGVGIGLAVASKYSALPIVAAPLLAAFLAGRRSSREGQEARRNRQLARLVIVGAVALVVFAITSPYVLLDFPSFWQAVVKEQGDMVSGVTDMPFTRQYRGTVPYLYFLEQQVRWGMGWPLGLLAMAGLAWVLVRAILRRASAGEWIVLSWVILYFGSTGLFLAKFMRYMAPVVPLFVLFGAGFISTIRLKASGKKAQQCGGQDSLTSEPQATGSPESSLPAESHARRVRLGFLRYVVIGVALLGAVGWSLAFVNGVYGTEHSWVTASRWVYAQVPDGSCIAGEHWEEGFPQSWPESGMNPGAHRYHQPLLPMYEEDTRQKFETIRDTLKSCDYLVLASNRLWRTIPRLWPRYPMSTRYYQALFNGELGFEQIYTRATPPRLGPWVMNDQDADESFTVYDHPRPIIFKKVRQLTDSEWEALLGDLWREAIPGYVGSPTLLTRLRGGGPGPQVGAVSRGADGAPEPEGKSLLLDRPVDELPVVDDYRWNGLANRSTVVSIVVWWLVVQVIGWLAWPLARRLFGCLPDRGYLLSKSLGWLLVGYLVWLGSSLRVLPNALPTIIGAVLVLAAVAAWLAWRDRADLGNELRQQIGFILIGEMVFTLAYLYFVGLRVLNPDLWQPWNGGEKMLEIGFLNAIVKSAHMPPYDPYFAGGHINYYYYGLFLVGVLVKLTGIQPTIAFNLAVPTLAALTVGNVFSLAYNLAAGCRPLLWRATPGRIDTVNLATPNRGVEGPALGNWRLNWCVWRALMVALLAVLLVVFVGNLAGFDQFVNMLEAHGGSTFESGLPFVSRAVRAVAGLDRVLTEGTKLPSYNYWDPTRAIPNTINEFPYFSFIFADLHPHMIGLPFTVLFLSLAYAFLVRRKPASLIPSTVRVSGSSVSQTPEAVDARDLEPGIEAPTRPTPGERRRAEDAGPRQQAVLMILDSWRAISVGDVLGWLALGLCLGALAVINTWDLPTYLGIITFTFWLRRRRSRLEARRGVHAGSTGIRPVVGTEVVGVVEASGFGLLTLGASYLLYRPFFAHYQPLDVGLGLVRDQTDLRQFLSIWGLFLFVAISYLLTTLVHPQSRMPGLRVISLFLRRWNVAPHLADVHSRLVTEGENRRVVGLVATMVVISVAVMLWLLGYRVPGLLLPLVCLSFLFLLRPEPGAGRSFVGLLLFTGLLILLGVEVFFLRDFLGGGEYYRMNTLFKFYIQAWVMLGIAAAYLAVDLWERAARWHRVVWGAGWRAVLILLVLASLTYTILGTRTRVHDRFPQSPSSHTLDGMAYMTVGTLTWPQGNPIELWHDHDAIRWLQANVTGTPVLAEAKIGYYREGGMRVASYTGLPMPLGGLHQGEQRWPGQISGRDGPYMEFWNTNDPERAWQLIQELDISYIYIGQLERTLYDADVSSSLMEWRVTRFAPMGLDKFDALERQGRLKVAYQNERTRIYQVIGVEE